MTEEQRRKIDAVITQLIEDSAALSAQTSKVGAAAPWRPFLLGAGFALAILVFAKQL